MVRLTSAACALAAVLLSNAARPLLGQTRADGGEIGWIGLFNPDLVDWLENQNRLAGLCAEFASGTAPWHRCQADKLAPKIHVVRLWAGPSAASQSVGALLLVATPGEGLRAFFVGVSGGPAVGFEPDLFDGDWGYGPYFHATIVERRGAWIRLPEAPFPKGTWVNSADIAPEPRIEWLEAGEIVSSPVGDLYVLGVERGIVRARPEQAADMWCREGEPPPLKPAEEIRLSSTDLYTATGHLRVRFKYTRGC
jgi:hypothetical protein